MKKVEQNTNKVNPSNLIGKPNCKYVCSSSDTMQKAIKILPKKKTLNTFLKNGFKSRNYNGILPCFFLGNLLTLFFSMSNVRINFIRVSSGFIISSINPRAAAP